MVSDTMRAGYSGNPAQPECYSAVNKCVKKERKKLHVFTQYRKCCRLIKNKESHSLLDVILFQNGSNLSLAHIRTGGEHVLGRLMTEKLEKKDRP